MITLVLADDHPIVLVGLERILQLERDLTILAQCHDGEEALRALDAHRPDVLVLDLFMPVKDGLAVLREIQERRLPTRVVVHTASLDEEHLVEALRLGAHGFLDKALATDLIAKAVRKVHAGERWVERGLVVRTLDKVVRRVAGEGDALRLLTARELEIVRLAASGLRNQGIASRLSITEGTVKSHLHNIFQKLGVDSRVGLVVYAQERSLI